MQRAGGVVDQGGAHAGEVGRGIAPTVVNVDADAEHQAARRLRLCGGNLEQDASGLTAGDKDIVGPFDAERSGGDVALGNVGQRDGGGEGKLRPVSARKLPGIGFDQQGKGERAGCSPPAVRAATAAGGLAMGDDQQGRRGVWVGG